MSFLQGLFGPPDVEKLKANDDVKGLIKALGYKQDASIRQAAAEALVKIGTPAVEPIVAALKDADKDMLDTAAGILQEIGVANLSSPDKAIEIFQKSIEAVPEFANSYYYLAYIYRQEKEDYEKAFEMAQKAVAIEPKHFEAQVEKGKALIQLLQFDQALLAFQIAAEEGSASIDCLSFLEEMSTLQGDFGTALKMKRRHDLASPGTTLANSVREKIEMAYSYKTIMVQRHGASDTPTWQDVQDFQDRWTKYQQHLRKGTSLGQSGDLNGAIFEYQQALELFDGETAYAYLGGCMVQLHNFNEALLLLNEAIDRNPHFAVAYFNRIITNHYLRNKSDVKHDFEQLQILDESLARRALKFVV